LSRLGQRRASAQHGADEMYGRLRRWVVAILVSARMVDRRHFR
jgi:hypothetical protein